MRNQKQKNQTGGSGYFDNVQLVRKNASDINTTNKGRPKNKSLRKAINDHCKSCGYDSKSGLEIWRKQIEDCPCTLCSFYQVRPRITPKRVILEKETAKMM